MSIPFVARFTTISVDGWIVFQQRIDDSVNFNGTWWDYKIGFGSHSGNFWMGLEKIHQLTNMRQHRLRMEFQLENRTWLSAEYDSFHLENESDKYRIRVSGYSGDSGDFLNAKDHNRTHNRMRFSTWDQDNDLYPRNCAAGFGGGWWYNNCSWANLNGLSSGTSFYARLEDDGGRSQRKLVQSRMMVKVV